MTSSSSSSPPLLRLDGCSICFGGLTAVAGLSLDIGANDLTGLIGPNGAGKTTVFNLITGVYQPTAGAIEFAGHSIVGKRPYQITGRGIARTFQNIRLFPSLSVFDNVRVAFHLRLLQGITHALWRGTGFLREEKEIECQVMDMLELFHLDKFRDAPALSLPYGGQRRLEIVRALATHPKLLLLDEPAAGMNPTEKIELMDLLQFVETKYRISVLLVDHDMQVVMGICRRVIVLDYGVKIADGSPVEVRANPKVIEAYLGAETPATVGIDTMLAVKELSVNYGAITALHGISLEVPRGAIVTLIGANGAGKTTTLRAISGLVRARGQILCENRDITNRPPHQIVAAGISHVPEGRMIFANLTVAENLDMGAWLQKDPTRIRQDCDMVFALFPRLAERRKQVAGTLSGGEQQMLAIGRALMSHPRLLMLDEPSLGIAPILVKTIFEKIVEINRQQGLTILLVEQNANLALEVSSFGYVLEAGRVILSDLSPALRQNPRVRSAYLGG